MTFEIRPVAPFDLSLTLAFVRGFGPTHGEQEVRSHEVIKAFMIAGRPVGVRVRGSHNHRERPVLAVELFADRALDGAGTREALSRVEALMTTYEDLAPFYGRAAQDAA